MLIQTIDSWAALRPEQPAHRVRGEKLSYSELKDNSDSLALWLHERALELGIPRGTPVVVCGHKQKEMPASFLACSKAGFPYIPIDISMPPERLKQVLRTAGAWAILSPQAIAAEAGQQTLLAVENMRCGSGPFAWQPGTAPPATWYVRAEEVYYIIFTSGSTGLPKGVQITLGSLLSFLHWVVSNFRPQAGKEVFLNQAPFSFDLSVLDLYMGLFSGSTLWSVDRDQITNPAQLFGCLAESRLSYWVSTPSFVEICLMDPAFGQDLLPELKYFLFCGEVLGHDTAAKLQARFPQAQVVNMYGPTEATVAVTAISLTAEVMRQYNPLPVGWVKPDCRVLICDPGALTESMEAEAVGLEEPPPQLSDGLRGEIVIGGPSVSLGYLNNEAQTRKSFFAWLENGVRWQAYRTGDEGFLDNGLLFYCGRLDFQIKLHGYRIETGDIEENLRSIAGIGNAVVLPVAGNGKVQFLQAFLLVNEYPVDEYKAFRQIREALAQRLPEYMIPRRIRFVTQFPLTPNGKVDRARLTEDTK